MRNNPEMPGPKFSTTVVEIISLLLATLAFYLEPSGNFLLRKTTEYGIEIPFVTSSRATVCDVTRGIKYLGTLTSGVEHYQNIFYAEDTADQNRFAPPVKLTPLRGTVIDATKAAAWCPQGTGDVLPFTSKVVNVSENCLSLRIARPRTTRADAKLPVVVWLHGGGHALGSAYDSLYEPDGLVKQAAADRQPLIFVAINYRLGFFGFSTGEALLRSKHTNVGLRDQRAALEWVRDNIGAFGGDSADITAIGQSVGASDLSLQMTAFAGQQTVPFSKAVLMSGGPGLNFNTKSDLVANNTAFIAKQVGCVEDGDAQSAATLACLKRAPVARLTELAVAASRAARPPFGEGFFFPTQDNDFLPDRPSELMRAGKFAKNVSIIASWVTNDGAWYAAPSVSSDVEVLASFGLWLHGHSTTTKLKLLELYPLADFEHMVRPTYNGPISAQYYRAAQMNKDLWFTCPVLDFAWQYVKHGGAASEDVRLYEHNATRYTPAFEMMRVPMWRVAHLSDIPYILNNQGIMDTSASQLELSKLMSRSMASFINTGDPQDVAGATGPWPAAFEGVTEKELMEEFPRKLTLKLFGGPSGTQAVTVEKSRNGRGTAAEEAVLWEKLFERCEFINSRVVRAESGV